MATITAPKKEKMCTSHDMKTGRVIVYPVESADRKYDFHFTKDGVWYYINSFDNPALQAVTKQCQAVKSEGETWRIVRSPSGEIFREG